MVGEAPPGRGVDGAGTPARAAAAAWVPAMPTAALFPGQASQTPDMRDTVADVRPDLLARVGEEVFARAGEDTRFAQPAIFCAALAGWTAMGGADAAAGHSLGELAALTAAGALAEADALRLVTLRGRLMSRCRDGGMLAVVSAEPAVAAAAAARHGIVVANDNAPGQIVLSGARPGIDAAAADLRERGVRVLELAVSGAFHSPLMEPAVPEWAAAVAATPVRAPRIPVWSCLTAAPVGDVRAALVDALTRPVRWRETVLALHAAGYEMTETGPGRTLTRMLARTLREPARA